MTLYYIQPRGEVLSNASGRDDSNNISDVAISFGGALSAPVLGGQIRLQSFFQSGW